LFAAARFFSSILLFLTRPLGLTFMYSGERCCAEPKSMRAVE